MQTINQQYRQGDVLIESIAKIPKSAKAQKKSTRVVLAEGTATGHHHVVTAKSAVKWFKEGETSSAKTKGNTLAGEIYVALPKGGTVVHEEHAAIQLPAGNYRAVRQREYTPEAIRNVND